MKRFSKFTSITIVIAAIAAILLIGLILILGVVVIDWGRGTTPITEWPDSYWIYVLILGILLFIVFITIVSWIVYWTILWYRRHLALAIYGDAALSASEGQLFYNLINVKRHEVIWNAHEDELRLFAAGVEIEARFYRSDDVPNGMKILILGATNNAKNKLALLSATKHGEFEVSHNAGFTKTKVLALSPKAQLKISQKIHEERKRVNSRTKTELINSIHDAGIKKDVNKNLERVISTINRSKATQNSIRYQLLWPENHPLVQGLSPYDTEKIKFFHIYNGKAYEIEWKHVSEVGSLHEYDLIGLEPGTIYTGISTSTDGGKFIFPSGAIYGITKNESGIIPTKTDAKLAKPKKGQKEYPMWNSTMAERVIGKHAAERTYSIIVKKHYEDLHQERLDISEAENHYDEFEWLKSGGNNKK